MAFRPIFLLFPIALAACSTEHKESAGQATSSDESASCATDSRVSAYTPGMQVAGSTGQLVFTLKNATPNPPAQGLNSWTLGVGPKAGPESTAYKLSLQPYMPDHGHGPSVNPHVTVASDGYQASNIDFFMGGVWRVTATATDANNTNIDSANFFFCVP